MQLYDELQDFTLEGIDGKEYSTDYTKKTKALVVVFTCNHCPYARAWNPRLGELVKKYSSAGVNFLAVNSNDPEKNPEDSVEGMAPMAKQMNLGGKYLIDDTQEVAKVYNAQRTPEVFMFDKNRRLVYHGAVDDYWKDKDLVREYFLDSAIESLLNGKEIEPATTQVVGCTIKWKK